MAIWMEMGVIFSVVGVEGAVGVYSALKRRVVPSSERVNPMGFVDEVFADLDLEEDLGLVLDAVADPSPKRGVFPRHSNSAYSANPPA